MKRGPAGYLSFIGLIALLVLLLGMLPPLSRASRLEYDPIVGTVTWHSVTNLSTDIVVTNGATLIIEGGARVHVPETDPSPYHPGDPDLSNRIEIIVEEGGTLIVESGAVFTSTYEGAWAGIHFLPGSLGNVTGATIRDAQVGITIEGSSPTIQENAIEYIRGVTWLFPIEGGWAAGIVISGTSSAQVISNTISNVYGGWGAAGFVGQPGDPGQPGGPGGAGSRGGNAYGIWVRHGASPAIQGNLISSVIGGKGGQGSSGGAGGAGHSGSVDGGAGGAGGNAGDGGDGYGILADSPGQGCLIRGNTLGTIIGGAGNEGGMGGAGGEGYPADDVTYHGGSGGSGGPGGAGSQGGEAYGILVESASITVQDNVISLNLDSGAGGAGGSGGPGGAGREGYSSVSAIGGNGGWGGTGGDGGGGGDGGLVGGILMSGTLSVAVIHNTVGAVLTGGAGSPGGHAGNGGNGGAGGFGTEGGNGGHGGNGGTGGVAGYGGEGIGIGGFSAGAGRGLTGGVPSLARNTVVAVTGGAGSGTGGFGGHGGAGGNGGGSNVGTGGDGGNGGWGGAGYHGGTGGSVYGLMVAGEYNAENNLAYNLTGGPSSGGGDGGAGGYFGAGGSGPTGSGLDGVGGNGGNGGDGGGAGDASSMAILNGAVEVVNNTFGHASGNETASPGGAGGMGAGGGATGSNGAAGLPGEGHGIFILNGQPVIYNNIVVVPSVGRHPARGGASVNYGIYAYLDTIPVDLDDNDVYDWDVNYYNVTPGPNDLSQDPQFVDVTTGDYHLKDSSPCIDQGIASFAGHDAPADDIDGETRPQDGGYDIGADENPVGGACTPVAGVTVQGLTSGLVGVPYGFTAVVSPANADTPIAYTWSSSGLIGGQGTASATYQWSAAGSYNVSIEVENCGGAGVAGDDHSINISTGTVSRVFLPLLYKQ